MIDSTFIVVPIAFATGYMVASKVHGWIRSWREGISKSRKRGKPGTPKEAADRALWGASSHPKTLEMLKKHKEDMMLDLSLSDCAGAYCDNPHCGECLP